MSSRAFTVGGETGTSATDSAVTAGTTYVYHVRAVSQTELVSSAPSNADLATTMVFGPLTVNTTLFSTAYFEDLRTAVNAVRGANGSAALGWASILPAGVPAPATGQPIRADYLLSLRSAMNTARGNLGLAAIGYTDPALAGQPIRAVYLTEIFGGAQ